MPKDRDCVSLKVGVMEWLRQLDDMTMGPTAQGVNES